MPAMRWGSEADHAGAVELAAAASTERTPEVLTELRLDVSDEIARPGRLLLVGEPLAGMGRWRADVPGLGHINMVNTHPDHRRRGIARAIVRGLIVDGREHGLTRMRLYVRPENLGAIELYESEGFVRSESESIEAHGQLNLVMYVDL